MADVGNHPQMVHFREHFKAKGRQSVMLWRVGCAVCPIVGQAVCEGHVTRTKRIGLPQDFQRTANGMPTLHANKRGDFALFHRRLNLCRCCGIGKCFGISRHHLPDDIDLLNSTCHRLMLGQSGINVDRPILPPQISGARIFYVGVGFGEHVRRQCSQVEFRKIPVKQRCNLVRCVIMAVDDGRFGQHFARGFLGRCGGGRDRHCRQQRQDRHMQDFTQVKSCDLISNDHNSLQITR